MYLPQMSYHPPVFMWSNYLMEYRERNDTLCLSGILSFLRSWYMYVFSILSALQLHIFDLQ